MKKYTYKNKKTGKKIFSDKPLKDPELVLVVQLRDGMMKKKEVTQK